MPFSGRTLTSHKADVQVAKPDNNRANTKVKSWVTYLIITLNYNKKLEVLNVSRSSNINDKL